MSGNYRNNKQISNLSIEIIHILFEFCFHKISAAFNFNELANESIFIYTMGVSDHTYMFAHIGGETT